MRALEQEGPDTSQTTEGLPAVYRKQGRDDESEKLDGKLEASASEHGTVRLWDSATGPARGTLTGHSSAVNVVAFSPKGNPLRKRYSWESDLDTNSMVQSSSRYSIMTAIFSWLLSWFSKRPPSVTIYGKSVHPH